MAPAMMRLLAVSCVAALLAGCEDPIEPDREAVRLESQSPPRTVADPQSTSISASRIDVTWADNSSNESGWEIHRSNNGRNGTYSLVSRTGANVTRYSDQA